MSDALKAEMLTLLKDVGDTLSAMIAQSNTPNLDRLLINRILDLIEKVENHPDDDGPEAA